ncbi:MAG: hypothetical protein QXJ97_11250 [Desulfurococcaceae archaeon]
MVAPLAAALIGGAGLMSSLLTNRAARHAAQRQMDFQREMSGTAYQRAMADMEAAGLNPMLVSSLGGASTPGGASYAPQGIDSAVSSALAATRLEAEIDNLHAQTSTIKSQTALNRALEVKALEDAKLASNSAKVAQINERRLRAELPRLETKADYDSSFFGRIGSTVERISETIGNTISNALGIKSIFSKK